MTSQEFGLYLLIRYAFLTGIWAKKREGEKKPQTSETIS